MKCIHCGKRIDTAGGFYLTENDEPLCGRCLDEYEICSKCDRYTKKGKGLCSACADRVFKNRLNCYSTKVKGIFANRTGDDTSDKRDRYYGMELELSFTKPELARIVFSDLYKDKLIYNKSDGSLADGVEIVTIPMNKNVLEKTIDRMDFDTLIKENGKYRSERMSRGAGVHLHVSKNTISPITITKLSILLNHSNSRKYKKEIYFLSNRIRVYGMNEYNDGYYCIGNWDFNRIKDKNLTTSNHRVAFNIGNPSTVEFRLFGSTTDKNVLKSYIDIVHNMIEFADKTPLKNINIPSFLAYLLFATKSNIVKEKINKIKKDNPDAFGVRDCDFNISNKREIFLKGLSLEARIDVLNKLIFTPNYKIDYNKPMTLRRAKELLDERDCSTRRNKTIETLLEFERKDLIKNVLEIV